MNIQHKDIIIIGAGITGLSCAYHLKSANYVVLESDPKVGGLCKSIKINGFIFDYTGHSLHLHNPYTLELVKKLLNDNIQQLNRRSFVYIQNKLIPYPFQANLSYLDEQQKIECLKDLFKTRDIEIKDFKTFCLKNYGRTISKLFMFPYNEKLWRYKLDEISTSWTEKFIPKISKKDIIMGSLFKRHKNFGYNVSFFYPKTEGIQALSEELSKNLNIQTNSKVLEINVLKKTLKTLNGVYHYNWLVSTLPLVELIKIIKPKNTQLQKLKEKLRWVSVLCFNIAIKKSKKYRNIHWIYFPEKKYQFYRIGFHTSFSKNMAPKGYDTLYIEISYKPGSGETSNKAKIFKKVMENLIHIELIQNPQDIKLINLIDIPYAYVIYTKDREVIVNRILEILEKYDIFSIGRYGAWKYSFIEECILDGKKMAEIINEKN